MITNITEADVESVLNVDDLDNALFPLQELAQIDDGGIASQVFSGLDEHGRDSYEQWHKGTADERRAVIMEWMRVETIRSEFIAGRRRPAFGELKPNGENRCSPYL